MEKSAMAGQSACHCQGRRNAVRVKQNTCQQKTFLDAGVSQGGYYGPENPRFSLARKNTRSKQQFMHGAERYYARDQIQPPIQLHEKRQHPSPRP
jgi:hypothetical protein